MKNLILGHIYFLKKDHFFYGCIAIALIMLIISIRVSSFLPIEIPVTGIDSFFNLFLGDETIIYLIEHFAGVFPLWLAPVQVKVLPVNNEYHLEYAKEVESLLKQQGFRVELDAREEKLGYRIREGQMEKVPYLLVLGNNERDEKTVTYREHGQQKQTTVPFDEFTMMMKEKIKNRQ